MDVFAQTLNFPGGSLQGPTTIGSVGQIITKAIPFIVAFAGFGLLLMIIASGFTLLTSAGDAKKMETGKQRLTYAIVGFVIIFLSYALVRIIGSILGVSEINTVFQ